MNLYRYIPLHHLGSMARLALVCVCFMAFVGEAWAQGSAAAAKDEPLTAGELAAKAKADRFYSGRNYNMAAENYLPLVQAHPENVELNYLLGLSYQNGSFPAKAEPYLAIPAKAVPKPKPEVAFAYAQALHFNNKFDEAMVWYRKSDPLATNRFVTSKRITECLHGKRMVASPVQARINNMGSSINTPFNEYLPQVNAAQLTLVFTSRRPGSTGDKKDTDGQFFEDIYQCRNANGTWSRPQQLPSPINTKDHDACVGFSADGQTMFIYRGKNGGDIFISELNGEEWSEPKPFEFNTPKFESSAFLSHDGKRLYFVSDRAGNKDVYVCRKDHKGRWQKPSFMNQMINTQFDEESPCESADGKYLYFSSKGHTNMGGYDIFKVPLGPNGASGSPENLGYPINTSADDVYFTLSADGRLGYFSSEKEGGYGKQDLYVINMPKAAPTGGVALLHGIIKDQANGKPTEVSITITDNETGQVVATTKSNKTTGEFSVTLPGGKNYGVAMEKVYHLFWSENIQIKESDGFVEVERNVTLPTIKRGNRMILRNMFYDNDISDLRSASFPELNRVVKFLKDYPTVKVEIGGHTDNVGSQAYNQNLSLTRARATMNYLIKNGIAASRLKAVGYAFSQPIAPNDTPEGRSNNRRTEITILEE